MMRRGYALFLTAFAVLSLPNAWATVSDLPERIVLKTPTESFSTGYLFAVRKGRIWYKANPDALATPAGAPADWAPYGEGGLPFHHGPGAFNAPHSIVEISADDARLFAVSNEGFVYFAEIDTKSWKDRYGPPGDLWLDRLQMLPDRRAWAIGMMSGNQEYYEDIAGNPHRTLLVTTMYVLNGDGRRISFNDPWLTPNHFDHRITTPLRGEFVAESLSAGASTMFVVNRKGEMYTQQLDTDSVGADPFIHYSYDPVNFGWQPLDSWSMARAYLPGLLDTWILPNEDWRQQPSVPAGLGRITARTTVLLNGPGNAGKELRVEGADVFGHTGYFRKNIYADEWAFVRTDAPLSGPFLDGGGAALAPVGASFDSIHRGYRVAGGAKTQAVLSDFNVYFNPARIDVRGHSAPVVVQTHPSFYPINDGADSDIYGSFDDPSDTLHCNRRYLDAHIAVRSKRITVTNTNPWDCSVRFVFRR